jgi:DNA-3-methyladenine glycosylase II
VKGIGPWTADAYLLSALGFPDVFPVGDRALQVGTGEVLGMSSVPDEEELEIVSAPWRPIRAAAARVIWHAYLKRRGRVEPLDPRV